MKNLKISLTTLIVAILAVIGICILATSPTDYFIYPIIAIAIAIFAELWNASENSIKASNLIMLILAGSVFALNVLNCNRYMLYVLIAEAVLLILTSITIYMEPTVEKIVWLIYSTLIIAFNIGSKTPISWIYITFAVIIMYCASVIVSSNFRKIRLKDIQNRMIFIIISSIMLVLGIFFSSYSNYLLYVLIICAWAITLAISTLVKKRKAIKEAAELKRAKKEREAKEAKEAREARERAINLFEEDNVLLTDDIIDDMVDDNSFIDDIIKANNRKEPEAQNETENSDSTPVSSEDTVLQVEE